MNYRIIIAGSRSFNDYKTLKETIDKYLKEKEMSILSYGTVEIVSGGAFGADSLGEKYAKEKGLHLTIMPAQWKTFGKRAGYLRNTNMAEYAHALVAFWDGKSKGTAYMIKIAKEKGLDVRSFTFQIKVSC